MNHAGAFRRGFPPFDRTGEPVLPTLAIGRSFMDPLGPFHEGCMLGCPFFSLNIDAGDCFECSDQRSMAEHFAREATFPIKENSEAFQLLRGGF